MINGWRFNDYFSTGVGFGFRYTNALYYESNSLDDFFSSWDGKYLIPVYARVKANLTKGKVSPFFLANVGNTFDVGQNPIKNTHGLMVEPAFGIDFKSNSNTSFYLLAGILLQNTRYSYHDKTWEKEITGMAQQVSLRFGIKF